jgi:hypothetical protein
MESLGAGARPLTGSAPCRAGSVAKAAGAGVSKADPVGRRDVGCVAALETLPYAPASVVAQSCCAGGR